MVRLYYTSAIYKFLKKWIPNEPKTWPAVATGYMTFLFKWIYFAAFLNPINVISLLKLQLPGIKGVNSMAFLYVEWCSWFFSWTHSRILSFLGSITIYFSCSFKACLDYFNPLGESERFWKKDSAMVRMREKASSISECATRSKKCVTASFKSLVWFTNLKIFFMTAFWIKDKWLSRLPWCHTSCD